MSGSSAGPVASDSASGPSQRRGPGRERLNADAPTLSIARAEKERHAWCDLLGLPALLRTRLALLEQGCTQVSHRGERQGFYRPGQLIANHQPARRVDLRRGSGRVRRPWWGMTANSRARCCGASTQRRRSCRSVQSFEQAYRVSRRLRRLLTWRASVTMQAQEAWGLENGRRPQRREGKR
jgi:hypothetical protein